MVVCVAVLIPNVTWALAPFSLTSENSNSSLSVGRAHLDDQEYGGGGGGAANLAPSDTPSPHRWPL